MKVDRFDSVITDDGTIDMCSFEGIKNPKEIIITIIFFCLNKNIRNYLIKFLTNTLIS